MVDLDIVVARPHIDTMQFADHSFAASIAGQPVTIRVTAPALHGLWGAETGAQDAAGLLEQHLEMIEDIVAEKFAAGEIEDGEITVNDVDLDI